MNIDEEIKKLIEREGGYINHPADRGGPTKYGITMETLSEHLGQHVSLYDIQNMPQETAEYIYKDKYYLAPKINRLPESLIPFIFDSAVNHGTGRAIKMLQEILNSLGCNPVLKLDRLIGPKTIQKSEAAIAFFDASRIIYDLIAERRAFYNQIVQKDPTQGVFLKGWLNRLNAFI